MRRIFLLLFLFALAGFLTPVYGSEPPSVSAQHAIVIDVNSGMVLYEKNAEEKAYPASITKIMTALLAIESGNLDRKVKVTQSAIGVEGSSIYLESGEVLSLRDLVYGLMLRSGNDAAVATAAEIGGTTENFVKMMNQRAREIGAKNTNFKNPSGLHHKDHYTTAKDMALISREAMKNEEFKTIVKAKSWVTDRGIGKFNNFYNKNKVVYQYDGGTGIKIGYTKAAGRTLVASSERNGMELICVVMNAPDWFDDAYKLMDYVYDNYELATVATAERQINSVRILGGDKGFSYVGLKKDVLIPVKKGKCNASILYDLPSSTKASVSRWQKAGKLEVFTDHTYLFSQPLYYLEDIE